MTDYNLALYQWMELRKHYCAHCRLLWHFIRWWSYKMQVWN